MRYLPQSPSLLRQSLPLWCSGFTDWLAGLLADSRHLSTFLLVYYAVVTDTCCFADFLYRCWGSKLKSSFLCGKHFTSEAISPGPFRLIWYIHCFIVQFMYSTEPVKQWRLILVSNTWHCSYCQTSPVPYTLSMGLSLFALASEYKYVNFFFFFCLRQWWFLEVAYWKT